jgi:hypothetical protein
MLPEFVHRGPDAGTLFFQFLRDQHIRSEIAIDDCLYFLVVKCRDPLVAVDNVGQQPLLLMAIASLMRAFSHFALGGVCLWETITDFGLFEATVLNQ